jgi:predicted DNA-binding transcriptional regulator AlpA
MKRGRQFGVTARAAGITKPKGMDPRLDGEIDGDRAAGRDGADSLREAVRETDPWGAFDARAIRELSKAAPADPKKLRRTIRRSELRQIVPLADSTIYELERRGEFPQRFFLTARCVVWDLGESHHRLRIGVVLPYEIDGVSHHRTEQRLVHGVDMAEGFQVA